MPSKKTILIPVDRYRVDYEIGYGTPFSRFDLIVLGLIAEDEGRGIVDLARMLCLPQRLLVESIVSLTRAGWVAIGGSGKQFEVTHAGRVAMDSADPPRPEQIEARHGAVVMERLTGQLATLRDINYWTAKRLQETLVEGRSIWELAERLERSRDLPLLDAGRAKPLLRRGSERSGWIRWVADPIPQVEAWLKVDVGEDGRVSGLPDAWRAELEPRLSALADTSATRLQSLGASNGAQAQAEPVRSWWFASDEQLALMKGGIEHWSILQSAFESARSQLMIASAFASADVIDRDLRPMVVAALERGIRVDLMWGYSKGYGEDQKTVRILKSIRAACGNGHLLRFNELPSGSHAKLVLWDDTVQGFHACVGSNNWLSVAQSDYGVNHHEVSVVCRHSGVASDLCTTVAGLWSRAEGSLAGTSDIWHRTAGEQERQVLGKTGEGVAVGSRPEVDLLSCGRAVISVVRDLEHEVVIRDLLLSASRRVGIASHKLGPKAPIRLASAQYGSQPSRDARKVRVVVGGYSSSDAALKETVELLRNLGGDLKERGGVHAKLVVADDAVLVTSFNPLSGDPFGTAENDREVGLLIRGKLIADAAWDWLDEQMKVTDD